MRTYEDARREILWTLADQREAAGEPGAGIREVELGGGALLWAVLRDLRAAGDIRRGSGYAWITEEAFARVQRERGRTQDPPPGGTPARDSAT